MVLDFIRMPAATDLAKALTGIDVIVNAVGIFRASAKQSFDALHVKGPSVLLQAARLAGVRRFVQVSALGADAASPLPYFASKGAADEEILASVRPAGIVVRPSLVFAPAGASTRWFAMLAVLPVTPLPGDSPACVQPLHLDDLVGVLVRLVEEGPGGTCLDAVGPRALRVREYLQLFKHAMRSGHRFITLPAWLARVGATVAGRWPRAPFDAESLAMLNLGNVAPADGVARWRGVPLRDPAEFLSHDASFLRQRAWLGWLLPVMRLSLSVMWIGTAVVSLWGYPRQDSLALLARTGLEGAWATAALWSAALLDLMLGLGMLLRPAWRRTIYAAQAALVAAYTLMITAWLPEQWLHPYGAVLKNLPLLAMIACLWALDRGHGPDSR